LPNQVTAQCGCPDPTVTDEDLERYISNHGQNFRTTPINRKKFTKWIFLHRNYFLFFEAFFNSANYTNYKGLRFIMVDYNNLLDQNQQEHKNQILFQIAAVTGEEKIDTNALINFNSTVPYLQNPNNASIYISPSNNQNPNLNTRLSAMNLIWLDRDAIINYRNSNVADKYTKSVCISKDMITLIANELKQDVSQMGVKCIFSAYNRPMQQCISLKDNKQFTLVMVPVLDQNSTINLNKLFINKKFLNEGFNHGSLCPSDCR
jgi:hypothetical protein